MTHFPLTGIIIHRAPDLFSFPIIILKLVLFFLHTWLCITTLDFCAYHVLPEFILSPHSALSLSDVEERCKQAAALRLPLSRMELNTEEVRELFQVRNPNITLITIHHYYYSRYFDLGGTAQVTIATNLQLAQLKASTRSMKLN